MADGELNSAKTLQEVASRKSIDQLSNSKRPKEIDLPWWVEFLFVQVGLPDSWLRSWLKAKKQLSKYYR